MAGRILVRTCRTIGSANTGLEALCVLDRRVRFTSDSSTEISREQMLDKADATLARAVIVTREGKAVAPCVACLDVESHAAMKSH